MTRAGPKKSQRRRALQVFTLGLATLFLIFAAFVGNVAVFERLSGLIHDFYQQIKPRAETGAPIAIVDVDEASLRALGQWPWPRSDLARIVDRLGELGAATVAFDLVFAEPDRTSLRRAADSLIQAGADVKLPASLPDNDELLGQAFARNGVTAGFVLTNSTDEAPAPPKTGFAFAGQNPEAYLMSFAGAVQNLPVLTENAAGLGFFSFPPSPDGIVRTVPLVARSGGHTYPALSVEALRMAQGAGAIIIRGTGASGEADTGQPAMTALKVGNFEAPTGPAGDFRVYYSGIPNVPRISAAKLLDPAAASEIADKIAGHIVLVGSSAVGLRDIVATPLSAGLPGVEVHAEIIDQILGGTFLTRPDWAPGAEIVAAFVLTLIMLIAVLWFGPLFGAVAAVLITATAVAASWQAFASGGLVLDPILPGVSVLSVYTVVTAFLLLVTDRERQFVRRAFSQYLAPSLVERLAENPAALALGGETREVTILFSDIRSFTSISEKLDPQEITRLLNRFLTPMTDVLLKSGATIDKYIGDAIMCFWNAPLSIEEHPRRACLAALEMLRALDELNARESMTLKIGIGLNSGTGCVGNLGSEQRFSYSVIGDSVNVAARVEGLTKQYGLAILISETTAEGAAGLALLEVDRVRVVGRAEPIAIFTLLGDEAFAGEDAFKQLADAHGRMIGAYQSGDFAAAENALRDARRLAPDRLARFYDLYGERLAALAEAPPPAWDGVFVAVEK